MPFGREADVVLAVGTRLQMQLSGWGTDDKLKLIKVDIDHEELDRIRSPRSASPATPRRCWRGSTSICRIWSPCARIGSPRAARSRSGWRPRRRPLWHRRSDFLRAIREVLPDDGVVVEELTQVGYASRALYQARKPRTFISSGYQGTLGWGVATALGVKHALGDTPVVAINGDGGFMFNVQELSTAVRHRIPVVVVVFNDGAYGNVRNMQKDLHGNRLIGTDLANPDFVRLAESFGIARPPHHHARGAAAGARAELGAERAGADRGTGRRHAEPVAVPRSPEGSRAVVGDHRLVELKRGVGAGLAPCRVHALADLLPALRNARAVGVCAPCERKSPGRSVRIIRRKKAGGDSRPCPPPPRLPPSCAVRVCAASWPLHPCGRSPRPFARLPPLAFLRLAAAFADRLAAAPVRPAVFRLDNAFVCARVRADAFLRPVLACAVVAFALARFATAFLAAAFLAVAFVAVLAFAVSFRALRFAPVRARAVRPAAACCRPLVLAVRALRRVARGSVVMVVPASASPDGVAVAPLLASASRFTFALPRTRVAGF